MFGYIASKKFGESQIWDYASVVIYAEIGYDLKCYRGKVFNHKLMDIVQSMEIGMQVEFAIFRRERHGQKASSKNGNNRLLDCTECNEQGGYSFQLNNRN